MFKLIFFYLFIALLIGIWPFEKGLLKSCSLSPLYDSYDKGYEDGYEGNAPKSYKGEYYDGWSEGDFEAECQYLKWDKKDFKAFKSYGCGNWDEW